MSHGATLSSHVLDLERGRPAAGLSISLYAADSTEPLARAVTDSDGRVSQWPSVTDLSDGIYRLVFATGAWLADQGRQSFYPEVQVHFCVNGDGEHYHVPLLLSAHGYSTYRGS